MLQRLRYMLTGRSVPEFGSAQAYNLWAEHYDRQPGNLMLHLDRQLFTGLLSRCSSRHGNIGDIGCGTGRHWPLLLEECPASITGFDVSPGMLQQLREKLPGADTRLISDNRFTGIPDACFDLVISTLTVAHIQNLDEALLSWCRMLKPVAELIITDFHPEMLETGGKRTFKHRQQTIAVQNYVHPISAITRVLIDQGFTLSTMHELKVDESVKHYYARQSALQVYERFKGMPVIYGMHLKRDHDPG